MLLVAIGCGRIPGIQDIDKKHSFVVFGTMDGKALSYFTEYSRNIIDSSVYFYETG